MFPKQPAFKHLQFQLKSRKCKYKSPERLVSSIQEKKVHSLNMPPSLSEREEYNRPLLVEWPSIIKVKVKVKIKCNTRMHAQTSLSIHIIDKKAQTFRTSIKYCNFQHIANQSNPSYKMFLIFLGLSNLSKSLCLPVFHTTSVFAKC